MKAKCDCYKVEFGMEDLSNPLKLTTREYCMGTRHRDECTCGGDWAKCDFYPHKREAAKKKEIKPTTVYYAHHQWKYGTKIEEYELDVIRRYFPNAKIFNPSTDLKNKDCSDESKIMKECLDTVRNSDILIFSIMDGMIGKGVYQEIAEAKASGKLVLVLSQNKLHTAFKVFETPEFKSDRLYARVGVPIFE